MTSATRAPVADEIDAVDLPVTGTLPPELTGRLLRNGPNPLPGEDAGHWFTGHGMVHGLRLTDGRAEWYRNRWVRTAKLDGRSYVRPDGSLDLAAVPANTNVVRHADRILALVESGLPYELTGDLATVGPCDFGGRLGTAMTAHPKEDPHTGELHFFGYGLRPPFLTYHRLSAAGDLVETLDVAVPGSTMMHDFAITRNHVVWLDLPVVFDLDRAGRGAMPYQWDDGYGARIGVMPRDGRGQVRWFDVDPCYIFHVGNAHETDAGDIVLDAVRYAPEDFAVTWNDISGAPDRAGAAAATGDGRLYRWTLELASGKVRETPLDDRGVEFPTHNESLTGEPNRFLYTVAGGSVVKYDLAAETTVDRLPRPDSVTSEAVYVPAAGGTAEDDGWLLSIVSDRAGRGSELVVLDASDLAEVASVRLPRRVPAGFHGSWLAD